MSQRLAIADARDDASHVRLAREPARASGVTLFSKHSLEGCGLLHAAPPRAPHQHRPALPCLLLLLMPVPHGSRLDHGKVRVRFLVSSLLLSLGFEPCDK